MTLVEEGGRIHSCISQPFSECLVFAGHKEKTTRVLPKEADKEKTQERRREQKRLEIGVGEEDPVTSSGWGLARKILREVKC